MTLVLRLFAAGLLACLMATAFVFYVRLPLPFAGFSIVVASAMAALGTLTLVAFMPQRWVWSDIERLHHAFRARHGLSDAAAKAALDTVTTAHGRADALRHSAHAMRDDVGGTVRAVADRIDAAAREIFYSPNQQRALRTVLVRAELIESAADAHAKLRRRAPRETQDASRQQLLLAVKALDHAFDQTDLLAARGLLAEVETSSSVAEMVLKPRRPLQHNKTSTSSS